MNQFNLYEDVIRRLVGRNETNECQATPPLYQSTATLNIQWVEAEDVESPLSSSSLGPTTSILFLLFLLVIKHSRLCNISIVSPFYCTFRLRQTQLPRCGWWVSVGHSAHTYTAGLIVNFFLLDNTEATSDALHIGNHLLLDQVEAHGQQRDAEEQIQRAQGYRYFAAFLHALRRNKVAETLTEKDTRGRRVS